MQFVQLPVRPCLSSNAWIHRRLLRLVPHVPECRHCCSGLPGGRPPLVLGVGNIPHKLNLPDVLEQGRGDDAGRLLHLHGGWKGEIRQQLGLQKYTQILRANAPSGVGP